MCFFAHSRLSNVGTPASIVFAVLLITMPFTSQQEIGHLIDGVAYPCCIHPSPRYVVEGVILVICSLLSVVHHQVKVMPASYLLLKRFR